MSSFESPQPGRARSNLYHGQRWRALGFRVLGEFGVGTHACWQAAEAAEAGVALVVCLDESLLTTHLLLPLTR